MNTFVGEQETGDSHLGKVFHQGMGNIFQE